MIGPRSKPVIWVGNTLDALRAFPPAVQRGIGFALRQAQEGRKHSDAKPLKGFGGASVLEVVEDHDGDTYRAVYTVRFADAVYVLHAFQKKSAKRISTPKHVMDLIHSRLKDAERIHAVRTREGGLHG